MKNTSVYTKRADSSGVVEVSEDFSLPDYLPAVERVVHVRAHAATDGKYLSGEEAEIDGAVIYTVLYVSSEGGLSEITETSPYTARIPLKTADDRFTAADLITSAAADSVSCRVTAPRKITLSCRTKVSLASYKPTDTALNVTDSPDLPLKPDSQAPVRTRDESHRTGKLVQLRKNAEVSSRLRTREGEKLVSASATVRFSDAKISDSPDRRTVTAKGEAILTTLILTSDGEYLTASSREPIEEVLDIPPSALIPDSDTYAAVFGDAVLLEIESSDSGASGESEWRVEYDIDCDLVSAFTASAAADGYPVGFESKETLTKLEVCTPICSANKRLTVSTKTRKHDGTRSACSYGCAAVEKCECDGNRVTVSGNAKITHISVGGGEAVSDESVIPFKLEIDALPSSPSADPSRITCHSEVKVSDITVRDEGDALSVTAELSIGITAVASTDTAVLTALERTAAVPDSVGTIKLYRPSANESAWDVEKQFKLKGEAEEVSGVYVIK